MPYYPSKGSPLLRRLQADIDRTFGGVFLQTPSESSLSDIMTLASADDRLFDFQVREDDYGGLYFGGESVLPQPHQDQYAWLFGRLSEKIFELLPEHSHGARWAGMYSKGQGTWQDGSQFYGMGTMRRLASQSFFPGRINPDTDRRETLEFSYRNLVEHPDAFQDIGPDGRPRYFAARDRGHYFGFDTNAMVYQGMVSRRDEAGQVQYLNFKPDGSAGKFIKHLQVSGFRDMGRLFYYNGGFAPGDELGNVNLQMGLQDPDANRLPDQAIAQELNLTFDPRQPAGYGTNYGQRLGYRRQATMTQHEWSGAFEDANFYQGTMEGRYRDLPGLGNTRAWDRVKAFAANILRGNWYDTVQIPITQEVGEGNWGLFSEGSKVFVGRHDPRYAGAPGGSTGVAASPADLFKNQIARWTSIMEAVANRRGGLAAIGAPEVLNWDTLPQWQTAALNLLDDPEFQKVNARGETVYEFPSATRASRSGAHQWGEARIPLEQAMRLRTQDPATYNAILRESAPKQAIYGEIIRAGRLLAGAEVTRRPTWDASDPNFGLQVAWNEARTLMGEGTEGVSYSAFLSGIDALFEHGKAPKNAVNRPFSVQYHDYDQEGNVTATKRLTLPSVRNIRFAMGGELAALGEDDDGAEYTRLRPIYASYGRSALDILMAIGAGEEPSRAAIDKHIESVQEMYTSRDTAKRFTSLYPKYGIGAPVGALPGQEDVPLGEMHLGDAQLMRMFRLENDAELLQMKDFLRANQIGANTYRNPNLSDINMLTLRVLPSDTPDGMLINKWIQSMSVGDFDPDHAIAYLRGQIKINRKDGGFSIQAGKDMPAPMTADQIVANRMQMDRNMSGLGSAEYGKWADDAADFGYDVKTDTFDINKQKAMFQRMIRAVGAGGEIGGLGVQQAFGIRAEFKNQMGMAFNFGRALNILSGGQDEFAQLALPAYQKALDEKAFSGALDHFFGVYNKLQPATASYVKGPVAPGEQPEFVNYGGKNWDTAVSGARNVAMLHSLTSLVRSDEFKNKDFLVDLITSDPDKRAQLRGALARMQALPAAEQETWLSREFAFLLGDKTWDKAGQLGVLPTAIRAAASARWNEDKAPLSGEGILWAKFGQGIKATTRFLSGDLSEATLQGMVVPGHMEPFISGLMRGTGTKLELDDFSRPEYSQTMSAWSQRLGLRLGSTSEDRNQLASIMPEEAEILEALEEQPELARALYAHVKGGSRTHQSFRRYDNPALAGASEIAARAFKFFGGDPVWSSNWTAVPGHSMREALPLAERAQAWMAERGAGEADWQSWASLMGAYNVTFSNPGSGWTYSRAAGTPPPAAPPPPYPPGSAGAGLGATPAAGGGGATGGTPPPSTPPPSSSAAGGSPRRPSPRHTPGAIMSGFERDVSYARRLLAQMREEKETAQIDFGENNAPAALRELRRFMETGELDETMLYGALPGQGAGVSEHAVFSSLGRVKGALMGDGRVTRKGAMQGHRALFTTVARNLQYLDKDSDDYRYFTGGEGIADFKAMETDIKAGFVARAAAKATGGGGSSRAGGGPGVPQSADQLEVLNRGLAAFHQTLEQLNPKIEQLTTGAASSSKELEKLNTQIAPLKNIKDHLEGVLKASTHLDAESRQYRELAKAAGITDPGKLDTIARAPYMNRMAEIGALEGALKDATPRTGLLGRAQDALEDVTSQKNMLGKFLRGGQVLSGMQMFYLSRMDRMFIEPALQGALQGAQDEQMRTSVLAQAGYDRGIPGTSMQAGAAYNIMGNEFQRQAAATWSPLVRDLSNLVGGGAGGAISIGAASLGSLFIGGSLGGMMFGPPGAVVGGLLAAGTTAFAGASSRSAYLRENPEFAALDAYRGYQAATAYPDWQAADNENKILPGMVGHFMNEGLTEAEATAKAQQVIAAQKNKPPKPMSTLESIGAGYQAIADQGSPNNLMESLTAAERAQVLYADLQNMAQNGLSDQANQSIWLQNKRYFGGGLANREMLVNMAYAGVDLDAGTALIAAQRGGSYTSYALEFSGYQSDPGGFQMALQGMGSPYGQAMATMGKGLSPEAGQRFAGLPATEQNLRGGLMQNYANVYASAQARGLPLPGDAARIQAYAAMGPTGQAWARQMIGAAQQRYSAAGAVQDFMLGHGVSFDNALGAAQGLFDANSPQANLLAQGVMSGSANALSVMGAQVGDASLITREVDTGLPMFTTSMSPGGVNGPRLPEVSRLLNSVSPAVRSALQGYRDPQGILQTAGGLRGLQHLAIDTSFQATMASAGFAIAGVNRDIAQNMGIGLAGHTNLYAGQALPWSTDGAVGSAFVEGRGLWAVQDDAEKLQRTQKRWQLDQAGVSRDMQLRHYNEQWDFNRMYAGVQFGYQQQDFAFRGAQMRMQRGWQEEDWSFERNMRSMQFGWKMEDYDDNIRYATGRDRRIMERERGRAVTMHNIEGSRAETLEGRQRDAWKMEDTRFETEKKRAKELYDLSMQRMDMEKRHFMERLSLDDQARDRQRQWMLESEKLEDEQKQLQRSFWKEGADAQKAAAGAQAGFAAKQHEIQKTSLAIQELAENTNAKLRLRQETETSFYTSMARWFEQMIFWVKNGGNGAPPPTPTGQYQGWGPNGTGGGGGGGSGGAGGGENVPTFGVQQVFSGAAAAAQVRGQSGGGGGLHIYLDGNEIAFHVEEKLGSANGKRISLGRRRN